MQITDDQLEEFGQMADTCDNLIGALEMPLPPAMQIEQTKLALQKLSAQIKALVVAIGGDNPWEEAP